MRIREEDENVYGQLYSLGYPSRMHHCCAIFLENIPDIEIDEISMVLEQLNNERSLGDDGFMTELFKGAVRHILKALAKLFNAVILRVSTTDLSHF